MMQRVCPVCDQVMKSAHYCGTCKSWVKDPWVREINYYLNERHPQNEAGCSYHEGNQGREHPGGQIRGSVRPNAAQPNRPRQNTVQPASVRFDAAGQGRSYPAGQKTLAGDNKKKKNINLILVIVIAIYLTFMLVGAGLVGSMRKSLFSGSGSNTKSYGEYYEPEMEEPVYHELEDGAVIAAGEACNSLGHFDIQGEELQQPLEEILETLGYGLEDCYKYSTNEIYDSGESWFNTVLSLDLEQGDSNTYQYIEINYDTATGDLHEVDVVMSDGMGVVVVAEAVLRYLEDAGAIPQDQACSEAAAEELGNAVLSGENMNYIFGAVEISVYCHSDSYGVYISHTLD